MIKISLKILAWLLIGAGVALAWGDFYIGFLGTFAQPSFASRRFLFVVLLAVGLAAVWFYALYAALSRRAPRDLLFRVDTLIARLPFWLRSAVGFLVTVLPAYFILFDDFGRLYIGYWFRLAFLLAAAGLGAWVVFPPSQYRLWGLYFACAVCAAGAWFAIGGWWQGVSAYPFGLSWSDGNRIFDYSILFGSQRYLNPEGEPIFANISAGRQFLWGLIFLIPNVNIWTVRLWDALLWILPALGLGWFAVKRSLPVHLRAFELLFALWVFSFLTQGPIYAPLIICAILVVLALRTHSLGVSALLVLVSGYFAATSRWTWTYAPGLWAGLLALLEIHEPGFSQGKRKELIRPVVLGIAGYLGGQFLPALVKWLQKGIVPDQLALVIDPTEQITSQPLLWNRLLPNPTYTPGILLGVIWAGLALVVLLIWLARQRIWRLNWLQGLSLGGITLLFFGLGMIKSTKIGGGSNLHNLDMFWITLALAAAWAFKALMVKDFRLLPQRAITTFFLGFALCMPLSYHVMYNRVLGTYPQQAAQEVIQLIQEEASKTEAQGGKVLFIDQRQLLTFGNVKGIPLIDDYEKKYLMEMAMRGNKTYFYGFYRDLATHRFDLIVSEPLWIVFRGDRYTFGNENDAWVHWVSIPILRYYKPIETNMEVGIQLLVPREKLARPGLD